MAQPSPSSSLRRPDWLVQFGQRLLLARGRAGLTQLALASPDLSKSFISLLESGRTFPSVETVIALGQRLSSSVAGLLMDLPELRLETALNLVHLASHMDLTARGDEAVKLVAAAEALLPDMPIDLRIRAALLRGRASIAANQLEEAARWVDDAVAMARRQRRPNRLGMALALKGEIEVRQRTYQAAVPLLEDATTMMQRAKEARTEECVRALVSLGTARWQLGQMTGARKAFARAGQLAARLRLTALRGKALTGLGMVEWMRRRLDSAVTYLTEAHDEMSQAEDVAEVSRVLSNLGLIRREQGRLDDALSALERALRIRERLADPRARSATLDEIAQVQLEMGRHADASRSARRALKEAQAGRDRMREAEAQMTLGRVMSAQGRSQEATPLLRSALSTFKRLGLKSRTGVASAELGLMPVDAGAQTEGARYLRQGSRRSRGSKARSVDRAAQRLQR